MVIKIEHAFERDQRVFDEVKRLGEYEIDHLER